MKNSKFSFIKFRKKRKSIPRNKQEEQLFINPQRIYLRNKSSNKNKFIYIFTISLIILIFIILIISKIITKKTINYDYNDAYIKSMFTQFKPIYNNNIKSNTDLSKYKNMLPSLTSELNTESLSIEEIFNARQIYISDIKITPEYIKFIRPINETEEEKYQKRYSEHDTIIDKKLFEKRLDQFKYTEFCKLALDEKLLNNSKISFDKDKPLISIVIPVYNKKNILLKSIRSIQNQNYKNIEIILVNDCSKDNSTELFNYLLKSDPRIRIFHHIKNMGCWRTRLDGIIYSRGQYIILFDPGDLYADNYVLQDAYNVIDKYNLDSCKFLFRIIRSFNNLTNSVVNFHAGLKSKIAYEKKNIIFLDFKVFYKWGNIWNRLVRANIFTKAIYMLNELILNVHKNVWDDIWFNKIINKASFSYAIYERVGYIYLQDGSGEGSPQSNTDEQKSKMVKEHIAFLYYDYNFADNKTYIIQKLREYEKGSHKVKLSNFKSDFKILNEFLEQLIKDNSLSQDDRNYCEKLLNDSIFREKEISSVNSKQ